MGHKGRSHYYRFRSPAMPLRQRSISADAAIRNDPQARWHGACNHAGP